MALPVRRGHSRVLWIVRPNQVKAGTGLAPHAIQKIPGRPNVNSDRPKKVVTAVNYISPMTFHQTDPTPTHMTMLTMLIAAPIAHHIPIET